MTKKELKEQDIRLNKLCFDYQEREKRIADLEKENAELKDKLNKIEKKYRFNFVDLLHDIENESKQEEQLTKVKDILTKILQRIPDFKANSIKDLSLLNALSEAEQFLKESE